MADKKFVIVGKGGSGKDYLVKTLEKAGFKANVSFTTRPKRDGEEDGKDYNFLDRETFELAIKEGDFQEYDEFNGWYYGTSAMKFKSCDIFIKTPRGVAKMSPEERKSCVVIFLDIQKGIRKKRLSKRTGYDMDSVDRRLKADTDDFRDFKDFDVRIINHEF